MLLLSLLGYLTVWCNIKVYLPSMEYNSTKLKLLQSHEPNRPHRIMILIFDSISLIEISFHNFHFARLPLMHSLLNLIPCVHISRIKWLL